MPGPYGPGSFFIPGAVYLYHMQRQIFLPVLVLMFSACQKQDDIPPRILLTEDTTAVHYRTFPWQEPGYDVIDNHECNDEDLITISNNVDIWRYGSYTVEYRAEDAAGNSAEAIRNVEIVLRPDDYYSLTYAATDSCDSGVFNYTALIQDCDCANEAITVGNISNFGLSAIFTLPLEGTFSELVVLDTTKSGVDFLGFGNMSPAADTLYWQYSLTAGSSTDACTSVWVKQ